MSLGPEQGQLPALSNGLQHNAVFSILGNACFEEVLFGCFGNSAGRRQGVTLLRSDACLLGHSSANTRLLWLSKRSA